MRDSITVTITKTRQETADTVTLYFKRPFEFTAGQYITIFIPDSTVTAGKAYSLSSLPTDDLASITVKNVGGEFSQYLCSRREGDTIHISRAYGNFNPHTTAPLVGITGGCALSPIWSVLASAPTSQDTYLFYAHKTPRDVVFKDELAASPIQAQFFCTRHTITPDTTHHNGRFRVSQIIQDVPRDAHFLLCGTADFVRDIWQQLDAAGIDSQRISTETFFES